jgi:hypothetical protein
MADQYGWDKNNPKHQESYWQGRADPRGKSKRRASVQYRIVETQFLIANQTIADKGDSHDKYNSHLYKVIDRQIAADHHAQTYAHQGTYAGRGGGSNQGQAGGSGKVHI